MIIWEGGCPLLRSAWVASPQGWRTPSGVLRHTSHASNQVRQDWTGRGRPLTRWDRHPSVLHPPASDPVLRTPSHLGSK